MSPRSSMLLELDQYLAVAPLTDVDRSLDPAAPDVARLPRHDVGLDVRRVGPRGIRLGHRRDAVAFDLDQHVVSVVPVGVRPCTGCQIHRPDADALVLEQETGGDVAE